MNARRDVSADQATEILDARQRRNQREALETLRRHLAHAIGEMQVPAARPEIYTIDFGKLVEKFKFLDQIAAEALADSGILDATTKEEAGRLVSENTRLRLLVHAGILLHEKVRECEDQDENETDEREWYWAARDLLGTSRPPIPHGADSDRAVVHAWLAEARAREPKPEPEAK